MKRTIEGTLRLVVRSSLWTLAVVLLVTAAEAQAAPNSRKMLVSSNIRASNLPQEESSAQAGISFEFSAVPLADALDVIATLSRSHLVYSDGLLPSDARVTLRGHRVQPERAFELVLSGTPLQVVVLPSGFAAVVRRKPVPHVVLLPQPRNRPPAISGNRATGQAAGIVVGLDREPVTGAYVRLCGTRQVQLTDSLGRFAFTVASGRGRVSASVRGLAEQVADLRLSSSDSLPNVLHLTPRNRAAAVPSCPDR